MFNPPVVPQYPYYGFYIRLFVALTLLLRLQLWSRLIQWKILLYTCLRIFAKKFKKMRIMVILIEGSEVLEFGVGVASKDPASPARQKANINPPQFKRSHRPSSRYPCLNHKSYIHIIRYARQSTASNTKTLGWTIQKRKSDSFTKRLSLPSILYVDLVIHL